MDDLNSYLDKVGPYQLFVLGLLILPSMLSSVPLLSLSFTAALPPNRCCHPELENCLNTSFYLTEFANQSLPDSWLFKQAENSQSYCRYCSTLSNRSCVKDNSLPCDHGHIFDSSEISTSMSIDFGMYCNDVWKLDTLRTIFLVGVFVGKSVCGFLADRFGRRPIFLIFVFIQIPGFIAASQAPNYTLFGILHFINGATQSISYMIGFVVLMEVVPGGWRTVAGVFNAAFYTLGYFYIAFFVYFIRDYRTALLAMSLPTLLFIPYYWLFPESTSWALLNGKSQIAKKSLQFAAKLNGFEIEPSDLANLNKLDVEKENNDLRFLDLFRRFRLVRSYLIIWVNWFACGAVYYGLSLNTGDLPGNAYVNFILSGVVELPGLFLSIPMIEFLGRKPSLIILQGTAGSCLIATGFIPHKDFKTLIVVLATIGKLAISGAFAVIFQFTSESYPTNLRSTGSSLSSLFARTGALLAPQIHLLAYYAGEWLAMTTYGTLALFAAILNIFLHETKHLPLPVTIQDAVSMSSNSWRSCRKTKTVLISEEESQEMAEMIQDPYRETFGQK